MDENNFYMRNRKKFTSEMCDNSILIMFSGESTPKRGDEFHQFTPKRNFYYITGIDSPGIVLMIYKKDADCIEETLFLQRPDDEKQKWNGCVLDDETSHTISGIEDFGYVDEFDESVARTIFRLNITKIYIDLENRYWNIVNNDIKFANDLKYRFPAAEIINAYYIFADHRMVKYDWEIRNIQKAIDITAEGLYFMLKNICPGMIEYEAEAYFDFILKLRGVKEHAFPTIAASGANATILHYSANNSILANGDLLLLDLGAQFDYYSADITRTVPVNGHFTDRQRQLYEIVLEGQRKVIDTIRPGIEFSCLNDVLTEHYLEKLGKIGLIKDKDDLSKYYYHRVSHMLGLETHDIGRSRESKLKTGMVLTVEPGLYIADEGIGIRIEDDVAVTGDGCRVLSDSIIKTPEEIENFITLHHV